MTGTEKIGELVWALLQPSSEKSRKWTRHGVNQLCIVSSWHTVKYPSREGLFFFRIHTHKGLCVYWKVKSLVGYFTPGLQYTTRNHCITSIYLVSKERWLSVQIWSGQGNEKAGKSWRPNGDASRRKLKTCVYLRVFVTRRKCTVCRIQ